MAKQKRMIICEIGRALDGKRGIALRPDPDNPRRIEVRWDNGMYEYIGSDKIWFLGEL